MRKLVLAATVLACAPAVMAQEPLPLQTYPIEPCRIADSRVWGLTLNDGDTGHFWIPGLCEIPWDAKAILATVTAVAPSGAGFMTIYAAEPRPLATSVSFAAKITTSALVFTKLSEPYKNIRIFARVAGRGHVDWTIDVVAYLK